MIPNNITRDHILNAIQMVAKNGIPKRRNSRDYNLAFGGKTYPPKYIISLANNLINGEELKSSDFGGGQETNDYLERLGFEITCKSQKTKQTIKSPKILTSD